MCRQDRLTPFLDMGFQPPSDEFRRKDQLMEPVAHYPLSVCLCENCGLSQLSYVVSKETLYRHDYPYEASTTATGRKHFADFAESTIARLGLKKDDLVVDVGSNVGVLLDGFKARGLRALGVEPAANIAAIAEKRGVETLNEFFSSDLARSIRSSRGAARLITGSNVFAHVDDLVDFMKGVDALLADDGVFIFESPDTLEMVRGLEFDTIYHEHLSYLSLRPVIRFAAGFGLEVFDVAKQAIHGGSFRVFLARKGKRRVEPSVARHLKEEEDYGLHTLKTMREFAVRVEKTRDELLWLLRRLKHEGHRIAALSAPAKGMSLLNYLRVGRETIDFATEKSALKIGRFTPGDHIPVLPDSELLARMPSHALLLAWNFADEIMENLKEYRAKGGKFIIPIPSPRVVG
jgi:hypothetical protein